jgi:AraC-like DNA-binding protein
MTIAAIADTSGFASASHLSMVYKKHFNMTISSYRCQIRV